MKKINFLATFVVGLAALSLSGCKNQLEKIDYLSQGVELGEVGTAHNDMLTDLYQLNNSNRAATTGTTADDIDNYFGEYEIITTSDYSGDGLIQQLLEKESISNIAAEYMFRIENLLNNPLDTFDEMIDAINLIENEAKQNLVGTDYIEFDSYADTAKASLLFWTKNIETIDGIAEHENSRWIIKDFFAKNKHRIGMAAASDAAGAAAGAALGAAIGSSIPGVGTAAGAAIVGAVSGAISSAMGYKEDKLCVIVSLGSLANKK